MPNPKRSIDVELHVVNEQAFMADVSRIADEATRKMQLGVHVAASSVSMPGAMVTPHNASLGTVNPSVPTRMITPAEHYQARSTLPNGAGARGITPSHFLQSNAEIEKLMQTVSSYVTRAMAGVNTQLHGLALQKVNELNRYSQQLATAAERAQVGGRVNPQRVAGLQSKVGALQGEIETLFRSYTLQHPPTQLNTRAQALQQTIEGQLKLPEAKQNTELLAKSNAEMNRLAAIGKTAEAYQRALAVGQYATTMAAQIPSTAYGTPTPMQQYALYHGHARNTIGALLPGFAGYLGIKGLSASYQFASGLAQSAGAVAMQAGGTMNPTDVYNRLLNQGHSQGISATQLASAAQLQGEFSGTSNIAFLFRDTQQTAQFARSMGISQAVSAQIMGSYQLGGGFSAGNEAGTAQQIMAAAAASGTNTQTFLAGVQQLAQAGQRTGIETGGGVASSLSIMNQLGSSLGIGLFKSGNAPQTIMDMQQSLEAGPGQQSGLFSAQLLPIYRAVTKSLAPTLAKAGITNPTLQMIAATQTNLATNPKAFTAELTGLHNMLANTSGPMRQWTEMGVAQYLFHNQSAQSLKSVNALASAHYGSALQAAENNIKKNGSHGTKTNNELLHSIYGDTQKISANVERIASATGKRMVQFAGAVAPGAGKYPNLVGYGLLGADVAAMAPGMIMAGKGVFNLGRRIGGAFGGGGSAATAAEGQASGLVDHLGRPLSTAASGEATPFTSWTIGGGGGFSAMDLLWPAAVIGGGLVAGNALNHAYTVPHMRSVGAHQVMTSHGPMWVNNGHAVSYSPLGGLWHSIFGGGGHPATAAAKHAHEAMKAAHNTGSVATAGLGAAHTLALIAEVGRTPGFTAFVDAFLKNGYLFGSHGGTGAAAINATSSLIGSGIGSVGLGLNPSSTPFAGNASSVSWGGGSPVTSSGSAKVNKYLSQINAASKKYGVPAKVLASIMMQETGGNPYAINADFQGRSYTTLNSAQYASMAKQLISINPNVDMGLMQINKKWHPGVTPAEAANPNFAINFAAKLLKGDYQAMGSKSWNDAIRAYNVGVGGAQGPHGGGYNYLYGVLGYEKQIKTRPSSRHNINRKNTRYKAHA